MAIQFGTDEREAVFELHERMNDLVTFSVKNTVVEVPSVELAVDGAYDRVLCHI